MPMEQVESNQPETAGPLSPPAGAVEPELISESSPTEQAADANALPTDVVTRPELDAKAWKNRFEDPAPAVLLDYPEDHPRTPRALVARIHATIAALKSVQPIVRWQGYSWCWTITYRHPATEQGSPAEFAYLIPDPHGLHVAVPFDDALAVSFAEAENINGDTFLTKALAAAPRPHEFAWPIWSPRNDAQADAVLNLIHWKHHQFSSR